MLVSIIVITYNSSKYVLETLESAYRQTYSDIELIVSDDCSTDNTFELCQQWVEEHKDRFVRTLCTKTPHNGGIVWNYNHALKHAQGEWIKYIAGDDILCDNCIDIFCHNIKPNTFLYFSADYSWDIHTNIVDIHECTIPNNNWKKQLRYVLKEQPRALGAALFIEKEHLVKLGGFDMRFPLSEDFPIVFRYLTEKLQIGIINIPTIIWRHHNTNTSGTNPLFLNSVYQASKFYTTHYCWKTGLILHQYHYFVYFFIREHFNKCISPRLGGYIMHLFDTIGWKRKKHPIYPGHQTRIIKTMPFSNKLFYNLDLSAS